MNFRIIKQHPWILLIAISAILFIGLVFIIRGIAMSRPSLPLVITQKVRNISAEEKEWQVATAAVPGDVLEYFILAQLPENYSQSVKDVRISPQTDANIALLPATMQSASQGINDQTDQAAIDNIFSKGLSVDLIKPGEFVDLKWQSRLNINISFDKNQPPLLETSVLAEASQFDSKKAKTLVTISSTQERQKQTSKNFFVPRVVGMNPRQAYDDLGTGVVIAGDDLGGIKELRLADSGKILAWRLASNELIEAGIPAGLASGVYAIEFVDINNKILANKLSFTILSTDKRATVTKATPNIVSQGKKRAIILQGIHLKNITELSAKNGQTFKFENINQINDRALLAEVPATAPKGEYKLFVGQYEQDVKLTVN
ncbi:MAG: hypothetical protein Q8L21_01540 [Candidatus Komeilibacteria bacterium]|nr:hypothetical protein [Candidatus Komeilibacteria bacterium]